MPALFGLLNMLSTLIAIAKVIFIFPWRWSILLFAGRPLLGIMIILWLMMLWIVSFPLSSCSFFSPLSNLKILKVLLSCCFLETKLSLLFFHFLLLYSFPFFLLSHFLIIFVFLSLKALNLPLFLVLTFFFVGFLFEVLSHSSVFFVLSHFFLFYPLFSVLLLHFGLLSFSCFIF